MLTSNSSPSYATQSSISSIESNDSEVCSTTNTTQYGPIQVRLCRKSAPTLETGRRSKHLVLAGDEAIKREKRREKNRDAARKLKEKRQLIEEELNERLKQLEGEHSNLKNYLQHLHQRKLNLQEEANQLLNDPIIDLLSNDNRDMPLFFEQYSDDMDLFDESIEHFLNIDLTASFNSNTYLIVK
jgi:hypothetical protein